MSDSEDNVVDLNTQILMSIRDEIVRTRTELREEIATTRNDVSSRISTLEAETIRGFTAVRQELDRIHNRVDHVIEITTGSPRDHEARIQRLETAIAGMRRRRPRT